MVAQPVRVSSVVNLEPQGVLQEIARLLARQAADHGRALSDVHDLQLSPRAARPRPLRSGPPSAPGAPAHTAGAALPGRCRTAPGYRHARCNPAGYARTTPHTKSCETM